MLLYVEYAIQACSIAFLAPEDACLSRVRICLSSGHLTLRMLEHWWDWRDGAKTRTEMRWGY